MGKDSKNIESIHKYGPKYIFITESSSVPSGYFMKEGLRKAYPDEPLPKIYRIDPRQVISLLKHTQRIKKGEEKQTEKYENKKYELEEFFRKRIKDRHAKILIYDNDWWSGRSPGSILALLKDPEKFGFRKDIKCKNVKMNLNDWYKDEITYDSLDEGLELDLKRSDVVPISPRFRSGVGMITTKSSFGGRDYNFRGSITKGKLANIKLAKEAGKEAGEELVKQRSLEQKLTSIIGISGIILSLIFFSQTLTGNAIVNLTTKTTSIIGAGLFIVGIVGLYFWFKKK